MSMNRKIKREEAKIRQEKYDSLSIDKKIELVKSRGGSKKELARLKDRKLNPPKVKEGK